MPDEELDPILIQVTVPLPIPMIYAAFLDPAQMKGWLCDSASVDAKVGGEYVVGWSEPTAFESHGTILAMHADLDIDFSWRAPPPFATLLNEPEPKTHVYVRLTESPEGIDVTLEHSGWGSGEAWEDARSWHFHLWDDRLHRLKDYMIKAAYG
ncbi:MAG: SRPBCC domain-containing protein [Thermoplasmata archaeon]|nr:SRPBCC domain-containing protein [Thermoplasmata archaeon]